MLEISNVTKTFHARTVNERIALNNVSLHLDDRDFSPEEAALALRGGYVPIHLGPSRLRTETAAVTAVEAVYLGILAGKAQKD